tara:strand:+ start:12072 stop:12539 length:468 start_codon:yes stop_codon:yes gene_type:complete
MESLFPLGTNHYLLGGLLVGFGIALIYLMTGLVAGVSTTFTSTWSFLPGKENSFFKREKFVTSRSWRLSLVSGLVLGGLVYLLFVNGGEATTTALSPARLFIGGLLVGIGTRMAAGCPSGHGITGNAMLEKSSFVSTITFLVVGIVVALVTQTMF